MVTLFDQADQKDPDVEEKIFHVPSRDGVSLPLTAFRAVGSSTTTDEGKPSSPLVVLYFPGSFAVGSPTTMAPLARLLVKQFNAVVVTPTYRLAPEHPFPTGFDDSWDSLSWVAEHASGVLRADPSKGFVVGGISSGGNITNTITHLARDSGLQPPITGIWLSCIGVRLAPKDAHRLPEKYHKRNLSRSQDECVHSVVRPPALAKITSEALKADENSHLYSPMIWPTALGHTGFPKTYSQVCGMDLARDELLIFDDMLKSEGVTTRLDLYPGLPHCFFYSFKELPQSKQWEKDTMDGFAWLLGS